MSKTNDGGPAFPFGQVSEVSGQPINGYHNDGMSLRDYFAAKAMQVLLDNVAKVKDYANLPAGAPVGELMGVADVTTDAYAVADAMLRAREAK